MRQRFVDDHTGHTEQLFNQLGGDNLGRFALRHNLAVAHGDDLVGTAPGVVQIVHHGYHDLVAFLAQLAELSQQLNLVVDVQLGGWLIQQ